MLMNNHRQSDHVVVSLLILFTYLFLKTVKINFFPEHFQLFVQNVNLLFVSYTVIHMHEKFTRTWEIRPLKSNFTGKK